MHITFRARNVPLKAQLQWQCGGTSRVTSWLRWALNSPRSCFMRIIGLDSLMVISDGRINSRLSHVGKLKRGLCSTCRHDKLAWGFARRIEGTCAKKLPCVRAGKAPSVGQLIRNQRELGRCRLAARRTMSRRPTNSTALQNPFRQSEGRTTGGAQDGNGSRWKCSAANWHNVRSCKNHPIVFNINFETKTPCTVLGFDKM